MVSVVNDETTAADGRSMLGEICREGALASLFHRFPAIPV